MSQSTKIIQLHQKNADTGGDAPKDSAGAHDFPNPPIPEPGPIEKAEALRSEEEDNPFDSIALPATMRVKQVWAIGGGKGGVGKSMVAASIAIALSRLGNQVAAIDLDVGAANLHTALGVNPPKQTLSDFLHERADHLQRVLTPTDISNLSIISGGQDSVHVSNVLRQRKPQLLQQIRELDADYVVVDLGAGTHTNTLDFFLYADLGIITLLPEPTSIENTYRFIKGTYFRHLILSPKLKQVAHIIREAMDVNNAKGMKTPGDLLREINRFSPEAGMHFKAEVEKLRPNLVVNQVRTQTDIDIGFSVKSVCKKYFGIEMDYIGYLDYDSAVWQSIRRKRPLMTEFPNSRLVSNIERITNYLIKKHGNARNSLY